MKKRLIILATLACAMTISPIGAIYEAYASNEKEANENTKEKVLEKLESLVNKVEPIVNGNTDQLPKEASLKQIVNELEQKLNIAKSSIENKNNPSITEESLKEELANLSESYGDYNNVRDQLKEEVSTLFRKAVNISKNNPKYNEIQNFIREHNDCADYISLNKIYNCRIGLDDLLQKANNEEENKSYSHEEIISNNVPEKNQDNNDNNNHFTSKESLQPVADSKNINKDKVIEENKNEVKSKAVNNIDISSNNEDVRYENNNIVAGKKSIPKTEDKSMPLIMSIIMLGSLSTIGIIKMKKRV